MSYKAALDADARIAAKNSLKIMAALRQTFDAKAVYEQYLSTQPNVTKNPAQDRARARAWAILNVTPNMQAMNTVMQRVLAEGYVTGEAFADEQLRIARELKKADDAYVDWANWRPGDRAAALLLRPPDAFQQLLQSQSIALKEMSQTTVRDIGNAVADAIELGMSAERSGKNIMRQVANPARALSIAITEQNRAISYATINRYKESGLQQMEWEVSDPCKICALNTNQVVNIGSAFNSGNTQPPAHPHCRCVLLPVIPDFGDAPLPGATLVEPPTPAPVSTPNLFPTPKEQIDQVLATLQAGKPLNEALDIYRALDARPFEPGKWEILPRAVVKEAAIENLSRAFVFPMSRDQIERTFFGIRVKKVDRDFIEKAVIYKNGTVEVQFSSTGLKLTEAERQMIIREVEKLQLSNPKARAIVHIDKNASGKFGWAYGGKEDMWVAPRTITEPKRAEGTFKMPVQPATTQFEYTLAHEWGHLIDDIKSGVQSPLRANLIAKLKAEYPNAFKSGYSGENTKEFFAEMFTEFYNTGGKTPNLLVQAMAREFGWKVPEVPGGAPVYVAAKKPADYFTPQKAMELEEGVPWRPEGENLFLKKVLDEQGFLGKPRVVTADEFKKAVDSGALPIYRGVAGDTPEQVDQFIAQLLTGDTPYIGRGMFGDGTYFTDKATTALKFAKEDRVGNPIPFGKTIDAALDPRAKIGYLEDIQDEFMATTKMSDAKKQFYYSYPQDFYEDASMWAAANGYDAIWIKNPVVNWQAGEAIPDVYTIILNRTALIIKEMP
jgi:hypothetical protein